VEAVAAEGAAETNEDASTEKDDDVKAESEPVSIL
jgi:hypothetical protein